MVIPGSYSICYLFNSMALHGPKSKLSRMSCAVRNVRTKQETNSSESERNIMKRKRKALCHSCGNLIGKDFAQVLITIGIPAGSNNLQQKNDNNRIISISAHNLSLPVKPIIHQADGKIIHQADGKIIHQSDGKIFLLIYFIITYMKFRVK